MIIITGIRWINGNAGLPLGNGFCRFLLCPEQVSVFCEQWSACIKFLQAFFVDLITLLVLFRCLENISCNLKYLHIGIFSLGQRKNPISRPLVIPRQVIGEGNIFEQCQVCWLQFKCLCQHHHGIAVIGLPLEGNRRFPQLLHCLLGIGCSKEKGQYDD